MKFVKAIVAAATAASLVACGGGGGGGGAAQADAPVEDADVGFVVLAVGLFDAVAGLQRMLALEPNAQQIIAGAAGAPSVRNCPAGGTVTLRKTAAAQATLVAADCRLRADDWLIYDGTWTLTETSNAGYLADGTCPAGTTCQWQAAVDIAAARFGYGATAVSEVLGRNFEMETSAAGETSFDVFVAGEALPDSPDVAGIVNGNARQLSLDAAGVRFTVRGDPDTRRLLTMTSPFNVSMVLDDPIAAQIDKDGDGTAEKSLTVPWSLFGSDE